MSRQGGFWTGVAVGGLVGAVLGTALAALSERERRARLAQRARTGVERARAGVERARGGMERARAGVERATAASVAVAGRLSGEASSLLTRARRRRRPSANGQPAAAAPAAPTAAET